MNWRRAIAAVIAWIAGLVFLIFGLSKIADPSEFARAIANYRLTRWEIAAALALYLPWFEVGCGLAIFWRKTRASAALLLFLLTFIFTAALISAAFRGLDITCGCFGAGSGSSVAVAIVRNLFLLAGLAVVAVEELRNRH